MKLKKTLAITLIAACVFTMLTACNPSQKDDQMQTEDQSEESQQTESVTTNTPNDTVEEENSFTPDVVLKNLGEDLNASGIGNGKFDGDTTNTDFTVTYISGTKNAYEYDDSTKTLTFSSLSTHSV